MNKEELNNYLENNMHIEHAVNEEAGQIHFRNSCLEWYQNNPDRATAVTLCKLEQMSSEELTQVIDRGLKVEGITRITGYFTKTSSWNPGKRGELKDRKKFTVQANKM